MRALLAIIAVIGLLLGPASLCAADIVGQALTHDHGDEGGCDPSAPGDAPCILLCGAIPSSAPAVLSGLAHGAPLPLATPTVRGVDLPPPTPPPKLAAMGKNRIHSIKEN